MIIVPRFVIGVIYRPFAKNLRKFINELDHLNGCISKENKLVFLLGDWNANLIFQFSSVYLHIFSSHYTKNYIT